MQTGRLTERQRSYELKDDFFLVRQADPKHQSEGQWSMTTVATNQTTFTIAQIYEHRLHRKQPSLLTQTHE